MKKFCLVLLALLAVFAFAACTDPAGGTPSPTPSTATSPSPGPSTNPSPSPSPSADAAFAAAVAPANFTNYTAQLKMVMSDGGMTLEVPYTLKIDGEHIYMSMSMLGMTVDYYRNATKTYTKDPSSGAWSVFTATAQQPDPILSQLPMLTVFTSMTSADFTLTDGYYVANDSEEFASFKFKVTNNKVAELLMSISQGTSNVNYTITYSNYGSTTFTRPTV